MTASEAYQSFTESLHPLYDPGEARSIARIVFEDALRIHDHDIQSKAPLFSIQEQELQSILNRLLQHEPVQYILGQADFYGLKFKVNQNVLIPRQETEELVYWILETIQKEIKSAPLKILDIGTGSGCIPITLKKKMPQLEVTALDISQNALDITQTNANLNKIDIKLVELDILNRSKWESLHQFNIIVSNPPYIPLRERALMPAYVTDFEPAIALYVEDNEPLIFYNVISEFAQQHLAPNGYLFFECNEFNATEIVQLLENKGFKKVLLQKDMNGKDRMIRAQV